MYKETGANLHGLAIYITVSILWCHNWLFSLSLHNTDYSQDFRLNYTDFIFCYILVEMFDLVVILVNARVRIWIALWYISYVVRLASFFSRKKNTYRIFASVIF